MVSEGGDDWNGSPGDLNDFEYLRFYFTPIVDEFVKLEVEDSWVRPGSDSACEECGDALNSCPDCEDNLLKTFSSPAVHVQSLSGVSFIRKYRGPNRNDDHVTYPYMTAIIDVDMGDIQSISWDKGCTFCSGFECVENAFTFSGIVSSSDHAARSCEVQDSKCINGAGEVAEHCPLQLYVVWTGTDADGRYLTSSEMRFSNYNSHSLASLADNLGQQFKSVKDSSAYGED